MHAWYMFIDKGLEYHTYLCDDWIKWPQGSCLTISCSKMENCRETRSLFNATITPKTTRWFKAMTLRYLGWESGLPFKNLRKLFPSILSLQNPATLRKNVIYVGSYCDLYMKNHLNNNNIVGGISKILSYPFNSKLNVNHNERCMHDICL